MKSKMHFDFFFDSWFYLDTFFIEFCKRDVSAYADENNIGNEEWSAVLSKNSSNFPSFETFLLGNYLCLRSIVTFEFQFLFLTDHRGRISFEGGHWKREDLELFRRGQFFSNTFSSNFLQSPPTFETHIFLKFRVG